MSLFPALNIILRAEFGELQMFLFNFLKNQFYNTRKRVRDQLSFVVDKQVT